MRWLADECAAASLVAALRENGHDVVYIAEVAPRASDAEVLRLARDEARLLLTDDKDFGDLVFRQNWPVAGVVLLRLGPAMAERRWDRLQAAIDQIGEGLTGRYTVIEDTRLRSRPLPARR